MTTFIYCLRDPRTGDVMYVGKADDLTRRLAHHIGTRREKNTRGEWIRELHTAGLRPQLEVLEEVEFAHWKEAERSWIDRLDPPLNYMRGGNGGSGARPAFTYEPPTVTAIVDMGARSILERMSLRARSLSSLRGGDDSPIWLALAKWINRWKKGARIA